MAKLNAMTVDVEEYFQVEAFANDVSVDSWATYESRLQVQMESLLTVFDETNVKATFFTLGWIAEKHPDIIANIVAQGHELASHGFMHQHLTKQDKVTFADDIQRAKKTLEDISGVAVKGYRAPCFSISANNEWAHDVIAEAGYEYSSSSYPINHDLYGVPNAPKSPYWLSNGLLEIPVTTCTWKNKVFPAGGGGYFRLLPFALFDLLYRNSDHQAVANFYTHPWEFDPEQPRIASNLKSSFRHHVNQSTALQKLKKLCARYEWTTMQQAYLSDEHPRYGQWSSVANGDY
ncbi:DUF3473 domain-containing protein [Alteromonas sp. ASW11-36]|uniref:DUF3473 domain-containing protein n=1 Tax=Alteromonas arenosi TaxID=3055817 RepID=A0ABT7STZ5_9ALTE|nr:XrtA system polysaccharide deacetylase [Alteromonas sp. ASW11-36]MDM7859625.1 DUF3473 domain-containing protein [Alteromonas sp. ASW11-36]